MERKRGFGLGGKGREGMRSKATGSRTMVAGTAGPACQTSEAPGTREGREVKPHPSTEQNSLLSVTGGMDSENA